ncbi:hypothetical protein FIBSPDRAFT_753223 [Athelia psychrophila]|uniref:Uncharacterized protein n=1 Tax=Athelia psychrophila TaxID=1759441 RepID=A0A166CDC2_9AGAM|nr:hypothetical protein FIBSPDRAFT_753223 [Fibularhizoctonia sp. CBS 109695]
MSSIYRPPGESSSTLWQERSNLDGIFVMAVAYGEKLRNFLTEIALIRELPRMKEWSLFVYTSLVFTLATLFVGFQLKFTQMTFIDDRAYPGGPAAFNNDYYPYGVSLGANCSFVILNWLADGLLLYRYVMIWSFTYPMLILPGSMYVGSIITSICLLVSIERTGGFWGKEAVKFGIAYWTLSISLNIIITVLIVARLILRRKRMRSALGDEHGHMYTSISAMLIESAALYSVWGLVFLITYAKNSAFNNILLPALGQVQAIATMLIITRVVEGRGWSRDTSAGVAERLRQFRFGTGTTESISKDQPSGTTLTELRSREGKDIAKPEDYHPPTFNTKPDSITGYDNDDDEQRTIVYRNA